MGVDATLSKPVLPRELCDAIAMLREPSERMTAPAPAQEEAAAPAGVVRRSSGLRNLRLAEVLASLAVAPARRAR